jgi:hypothetical protein
MKKKADLSGLLTESTRKRAIEPAHAQPSKTNHEAQKGRVGTVPITVHHPKEVRDQLKILSIKTNTDVYELAGEAFNMLFATHGMPEVAPTKQKSSR